MNHQTRPHRLAWACLAGGLLLSGAAAAQSTLWGGQPTLVLELERESRADEPARSHGLTVYPGLRWREGWINQLEIRASLAHETEREGATAQRSIERDYAVRVRKNIDLGGPLGGLVRALVGQKRQQDQRFPFGYGELALTYPIGAVELYSGYRWVRALDNTPGQDFNQLRIGAGYEIDVHQEIEFRVARAWNRDDGLRRGQGAEIEYTYKF